LLKKYNVPVQEGIACGTVHEVEEAYRQIKTSSEALAVVKGANTCRRTSVKERSKKPVLRE
jgi:hypothetical protein